MHTKAAYTAKKIAEGKTGGDDAKKGKKRYVTHPLYIRTHVHNN
jgi:hypothetical protein